MTMRSMTNLDDLRLIASLLPDPDKQVLLGAAAEIEALRNCSASEPDWSGSETVMSESWKNPLLPMPERLLIADGAVRFERDVNANLRRQLSEKASSAGDEHVPPKGWKHTLQTIQDVTLNVGHKTNGMKTIHELCGYLLAGTEQGSLNGLLLRALQKYEVAFDDLFGQCASNPIQNAWGKPVSLSLLNEAHEVARDALSRLDSEPEQAGADLEGLAKRCALLESELATVKKVAYGNIELLEENNKLKQRLAELPFPQQPLILDEGGRIRFKANRIVDALLDHSQKNGFGMNEIAREEFTAEDRMQFAQLIGYSLGGYGELSYVTDESYNAAAMAAS